MLKLLQILQRMAVINLLYNDPKDVLNHNVSYPDFFFFFLKKKKKRKESQR
jgi:hypothetical protein